MAEPDDHDRLSTSRARADRADVVFHPPVMLAIMLVLGFGLRALWPLPFVAPAAARAIGPAVVVVAFGVFIWAAVTMRRGGAAIPTSRPTDVIVSTGPYRFSRNPIYAAMVALLVGLAVAANTLWFLALAVLAATLLQWGVISREEAYLERKFGSAYRSYRARVRRWL